MLRKTTIALALSSSFLPCLVQAATIYDKDNGDYLNLYGEVGVGGHIGTNSDYNHDEFYDTKSYVDDSFATLGIAGQESKFLYRLELDYQRENWLGGSGEFALDIDKLYVGYAITENQWIELGLTDTAFDDYDHYGDFTFNKAVETGEAGDQENTIKYQGEFEYIRVGASYSYEGEHKNGTFQGDIVNAYAGVFTDIFSFVVGLEGRGGSDGISKYGEQQLLGLGARLTVLPDLQIGFNGFIEDEDMATHRSGDTYMEYETFRNYGATLSAKYDWNEALEIIASANYEEYENWDIESPNYDYEELPPVFGKERTWGSLGFNYRPGQNIVLSVEGRVGEAPEAAYAYVRMYF
ncbi:porin [Shewanella corallii]|uniref:Porin n=1 Tax=Shewanella corallii TaxID=560080 RepID=A0ABT0NAG8_9GAMM|nr:porin [Shewanella corallii]MCL2915409.1 porin [Shewanella corallii]